MSEQTPISPGSDICQTLTCLPEKFVVDFANGIDVARERQRYMAKRDGFFTRLFDGFTGQGDRNQAEINASLTDGVEGALNWLKDLSESLAKSNHAIVQVNTRVNALKHDVATLVDFSIESRQAINSLSQRLDERCDELDRNVARIDRLQQAHLHLDDVFGKWGAGRFNMFTLSGRCYAALEELRWGAFGDYCQTVSGPERQKQLERLANQAIIQMNKDAGISQGERIATRARWLARPVGSVVSADGEDAIRYLGDWTDPYFTPFAFAASQTPEELPVHLPRIIAAPRVTEAMISELFLEAS